MTRDSTWLLTGGAGYIGAHTVRALQERGHGVVVLDDLSTGSRDRVPDDVPFVDASLLNRRVVTETLRRYRIDGVVHLAAKKAVDESIQRPLYYFYENLIGMQYLLEAMLEVGVDRMVFSSSAATYGIPDGSTVTEGSPTMPISPYGRTKLVCEWLLQDVARAHGIRWIGLRYFNVAGAGRPELGDTGTLNLIPKVFQALTEGRSPKVYGLDYPTKDGSCVRDFIHVVDLAAALVAAAQRIDRGPCGEIYNVGRGEGATVLEVLRTVEAVTGIDCGYEVMSRRPGDAAQVVANVDRARQELGWYARYDLHDMVRSAWDAWQHTASVACPGVTVATGTRIAG